MTNPHDHAKPQGALDVLCPLHVQMDQTGVIVHTGPTMAKLRPYSMIGKPFWDVFELVRPQNILNRDHLDTKHMEHLVGTKLHLNFRDAPHTPFKGVIAIGTRHIITNLSFGIGVIEAVRDYNLSNADFAGTDLAIEMLYLTEAKTAVLEESRNLNTRLQHARSAAEIQAQTDALTGLKNRRAMDDILTELLIRREKFACMHLDLDYFKSINDTMGHAAGDHVLQEVAKILLRETRTQDYVARVGGDEFVILFKGLTSHDQINQIALRIIAQLETPIDFQGTPCRISASAGTAISTDYATPDADVMLCDADTALYASKHAGRGQHLFFSPDLPRLGVDVHIPT